MSDRSPHDGFYERDRSEDHYQPDRHDDYYERERTDDHYERDRDEEQYERDRSDEQYERDRDRRRDDGWHEQPSNTVLVKSVPEHVTEDDLFKWFEDNGVDIRDIRLVPRRGSRVAAFAFVEFHTVEAAADWMSVQQGEMMVTSEYTSGLVYSRRTSRPDRDRDRGRDRDRPFQSNFDWTCSNNRCLFINFAKRVECFRCGTRRNSDSGKSRSHRGDNFNHDDGSGQVGYNPCNTVLLRGLDALTNENNILDALAAITSLQPKNCYVMRDFNSGSSMGYAFMEFDSVINAQKIKDHFTSNQAFEVDGKLVVVDYAKNTYSTILASIQFQGQQNPRYRQPTQYELQALAANAANQMSAIQQLGTVPNTESTTTPTPAVKSSPNQTQYSEPDVSKFQWDAASGYYYDSTTGFYYDSNTQYFYNSTSQQYMYWDGASKTYVPVSQNSQSNDKNKTEKEDQKQKAKNIAKEMEKWAKSQNKKTKSAAPAASPATNQVPYAAEQNSVTDNTADTAYELLVGGKKLPSGAFKRDDDLMPPPQMNRVSTTQTTGLVASYGGDDSDDGDDTMMNEANHIDRQKLTCNLCERKFNSTAVLEKHVQMSDLHKQNLLKIQQKSQGQFTSQYRDRAKERRQKEGLSPKGNSQYLKPQLA